MIFLTIGTQLPFDRLVRTLDEIAPLLSEEIVGQIGDSNYRPKHFRAQRAFAPNEFESLMRQCRVIVSHAGIGTILNARKAGKPIILMPRLAKLGEHRNDHQTATCQQLSKANGVSVVYHESELLDIIKRDHAFAENDDTLSVVDRFVDRLRPYIFDPLVDHQ